MSKGFIATTLAFLVTGSLAFAQAPAKPEAKGSEAKSEAKSEKAPRLTIIEPVKDYGTVAKGEKLDWAFVIKNTGDADLQIIAAKPGCGCTVADFDKVIKPGETGKVTAHVDTTAFAGPIAKTITLETNDPSAPTAQLTIHAIVKPYVEAYPAGFVRFNLLQGETDAQAVTLYSEEDEPFQIVKVESPVDWVKVDYKKIDDPSQLAPGVGKQGQAQYKFNVSVGGADAKVGPIAEKVKITTNSKHQPEFMVSISGVVRPPYRVDPTVVNFGEVAPSDTSATRLVMLHSNNLKTPETFTVTKAESSTPFVTAAIKPGANKGDYEVTLQIAKNAKPGDLDGTVKIFTSDKVNPVVTVPVRATIKTAAAPAPAKASK
jgi:hypothetical protein